MFDLRSVSEGEICARADKTDGEDDRLTIKRGIEVGHIFQLGTKYSEAMNASCLDAQGKATFMEMGCYGIGITRIVAASIEQNYDERGILWPANMAPFQVVITPIGYQKSDLVRDYSDALYQQLNEAGIEVLLDDRKERPGIMFADADLIGIPHRIVVGDKSLANSEVEYKSRSAEQSENLAQEAAFEFIQKQISESFS